jgi:spermidine synthase
LATCFDDPRLTLIYDDAAKYLREVGKNENYDVIICDSSDPVGPAEVLFQTSFFQSMHDALSPTGILSTQGECQWLHLDLIERVLNECRGIFPKVKYAYTTIPTYPSGQIGHIIASNDVSLPLNGTSYYYHSCSLAYHFISLYAVPLHPIPSEMKETLRYYTSEIHSAAFVLPGTFIDNYQSTHSQYTPNDYNNTGTSLKGFAPYSPCRLVYLELPDEGIGMY